MGCQCTRSSDNDLPVSFNTSVYGRLKRGWVLKAGETGDIETLVMEGTPSPSSFGPGESHLFSIKFNKTPLGIVLTPDENGECAFITETDGKLNEAVKDDKLPLFSKLIKCNGVDVEMKKIEDIKKMIQEEGSKNLPLELTFYHRDGLIISQ